MIVIVDYKVGNLKSVENMLRKAGAECLVSGNVEDIRRADKLILPGVGNFGYGMQKLRESGLIETLDWFALEEKRPVLGICLGAQILGNSSEEANEEKGLGWIDMHCRKFPTLEGLRVPHMGWGQINQKKNSSIFFDLDDDSRYYFVHSYFMNCSNSEDELAACEYGIEYTCAVQRDNIYGVQFHPEKSHRFGLALMKAFSEIES